MPPKLLVLAPLVALLLWTPASTGLVASNGHLHDDPELLPDTLLVTYDEREQGAVAARVAALGGEVRFFEHLPGVAVVEAGPGRGAWMEERLQGSRGFLTVDHDRRTRADFVPNDPRFTSQYGPQQIRAPLAWDITRGSMAVKVAIMDTGIDLHHEDLKANICGTAVFSGEASVQDNFGHGTHVSGTAAAGLNNGIGIAGMSNSCILHGKVLDGLGGGSFSWLINGVDWAVAQGARVISMSLGSVGDPGAAVETAMRRAFQAGVFLDASAGNNGCPQALPGNIAGTIGVSTGYPAAYAWVMATAATENGGGVAFYSNCGPQVDIAAPGSSVLSTVPPCTGGVEICSNTLYASISGTSMAAPHVAGVAALMFAVNPALTPRDVFCMITFTAERINVLPWEPTAGWGEVDAFNAVKRARDGPPIGQGAEFGAHENLLCDRMLTPVQRIGSVL